MCEFCVHGSDRNRWYTSAGNDALGVKTDLPHCVFIVDFVRDFEGNRRTVNTGVNASSP